MYTPYITSDYIPIVAAMSALVGILIIIGILTGIVGILKYVFRSIALFKMAKRRGIHNAWLAWIPIAYTWILGSLADQYAYVTKNKVRYYRIIMIILAVLLSFGNSNSAGNAVREIVSACNTGSFTFNAWNLSNLFKLLTAAGISSLLGIAFTVFESISLYHVYESSLPNNKVAFLILGIFFPITKPFFLFGCRNRDDGMPPKKEAPVAAPVIAGAPAEEPAEASAEVLAEEAPAEESSENQSEE